MSFSDEAIDQACAAAMRKPTFEEKLQEAAEMFLALEDGRDSQDFKRIAAKALLESAIRSTGNKSAGARRVHIHRNSVPRILNIEPIP